MSQIGSKVKSFFQNMVRPPPANVVAAAASATINTIKMKPHVPLIKFRKGSPAHDSHVAQASRTAPSAAAPTVQRPAVSNQAPVRQAFIIEDWQLPQRLRRKPLDQDEVDYINNGGPK